VTGPPQFSRRRRRWFHHQPLISKETMRCFTDEEIRRGVQAVITDVSDHVRGAELPALVAIFLQAAQPNAVDLTSVPAGVAPVNLRPLQTWPFPHPMHCPSCDRAITDATGRSLVKIVIENSIWKCATCP
jgi:hypothetical protein